METTSCGGVVIFRGKVLLLYKNQNRRYVGWVLPKGTNEPGESYKETAVREVSEEASVNGRILGYLGKTQYTFGISDDTVLKTVHWYLMTTDSFFCKPQIEEYFSDIGFYKQHEAFHLLKFQDEKQIMKKAYIEYNDHIRNNRYNITPFPVRSSGVKS